MQTKCICECDTFMSSSREHIDLENIDKELESLRSDILLTDEKIQSRIDVCDKTTDILEDASKQLNELSSIFNKKDLSFLTFALLLQGAAKYVEKSIRRMSDKEVAEATPFHANERSSRANIKYYASRQEIITNPVPFDAIRLSDENNSMPINNIMRPGFSGFNHRTKALGHDPILGLIFGTANILTSTITRNDFFTWHVKSNSYSVDISTLVDKIGEPASTLAMFMAVKERLTDKEGWIDLGCAFLKEVIHLMSDLPTKQSLPIPIIPVFSEKLARELSFYGVNTGNIVQGYLATRVMNWGIACLHRLAKSDSEDDMSYQIRTAKIIEASNVIATTSDLGYSLYLACSGDRNALRLFDLGGYIATWQTIAQSERVMAAIEREFYVNSVINKLKKYE